MIPNPLMTKYVKASVAYRQAVRFNKVYTKLLKSLENVFNGRPDTLGDALGLMYSVDLHLTKLLRTPVEDNGPLTIQYFCRNSASIKFTPRL